MTRLQSTHRPLTDTHQIWIINARNSTAPDLLGWSCLLYWLLSWLALFFSFYFLFGGHITQEAFNVPLVVQLTDDEKFLFKPELKLEDVSRCPCIRVYSDHVYRYTRMVFVSALGWCSVGVGLMVVFLAGGRRCNPFFFFR